MASACKYTALFGEPDVDFWAKNKTRAFPSVLLDTPEMVATYSCFFWPTNSIETSKTSAPFVAVMPEMKEYFRIELEKMNGEHIKQQMHTFSGVAQELFAAWLAV